MTEWYFPCLMVFYAVSPLMRSAIQKGGTWIVVLSFVAVVGIVLFVGIDRWQWQCAVGRIPIYLLGMYCAIKAREDLPIWIVLVLLLFSIGFFIHNDHYLFSATFTPFVVVVLNKLTDICRFDQWQWLRWIGKNSLEIYVADVMACEIGQLLYTPGSTTTNICIKLLLNFFFAFILYRTNKYIYRFIIRREH